MGTTISIRTRALSDTGEIETHTYWVGDGGGYVHEITPERPGTSGRQVCERLYSSGSTLMARPETLADVIRRELRRRREADRRDQRR